MANANFKTGLTALRSVENRFFFDKYPRLSAAKLSLHALSELCGKSLPAYRGRLEYPARLPRPHAFGMARESP